MNSNMLDYQNKTGTPDFPISWYDYNMKNNNVSIHSLVNNSPLEQRQYGVGQWQQTLNDIAAKYNIEQSSVNMQVNLGDTIELNTTYSDYENDPKMSERYKFNHIDPNYFDNPLGTMAGTGLYTSTPLTSFNKVC